MESDEIPAKHVEPIQGTPLEYPQMPYEWEAAYQDARNKLIDGERDYSKSYDKYVLTLSGGALALSMTFVHDIIGDDPVIFPGLIVAAWISLTFSVGLMLISIQRSGPLFRKFCDILDSEAENSETNFSWTEVRKAQDNCPALKHMDRLNNGSLFLFLSGVILLLSFTGFNLRGETSMTDKEQPQPKDLNENVKPAAAPVDGNPPTVASVPVQKYGKPPLAPIVKAPKQTPKPPIDPLRDIHAGGKPPLAPIFETPKPAEPVKPPPAPSEPDPSPPPEGDD